MKPEWISILKRSQLASLACTMFDYLITFLSSEILQMETTMSLLVGNLTGAVIHFVLGRRFVFASLIEPVVKQVQRYMVSWIGYAMLFLLLIHVINQFWPATNYLVSKTIVGVILAVLYTYPIQLKYVFK